jgi:hypothetical protein
MTISKYVDAAMQLDSGLDLGLELPLQPAFDKIAIETAEQLTGTLATEVKMCEIVHGRSLAPRSGIYTQHIVITRYTDLFGRQIEIIFVYREIPI